MGYIVLLYTSVHTRSPALPCPALPSPLSILSCSKQDYLLALLVKMMMGIVHLCYMHSCTQTGTPSLGSFIRGMHRSFMREA
jgi:hypothetical protein